ncbi:MAG: hypothetical protein WKF73_18660 [Nocardioidaceae bacterium]
MLLARMGLRAGEVAGLQLDDIDWRRAEITIRGKGSRRDRLPCRSMWVRLLWVICAMADP